ncbi:1-phosphofructokinase family hexose kinase [Brachybacterium sp. JHP9]|uniref:1-phosphofructokinase family hexose kinase n=1 Tax=Brachybacterium equifaecis TaxID=2910770 RepID=A0ABT0QYF6_9MICO|nr:1-phosphofructokinase family hexose kinase [Brachybacterium equifaecis]MCL6422684.1 1-phosphofructokinase family hexose kinase [Brachybacterium equifaecis]
MIITLTANPSLDRTVDLGAPLNPGGVHRFTADRLQPGGKGVNVALGVQRAGLHVLAVLPAAAADPLLPLLAAEGLPHRASPMAGRVRTNLTVLSSPDVTTKLNEPGAPLSAQEASALETALLDAVSAGDDVMLSGSLAPGLPADAYVRLVRAVREKGAWVGVDTSDAPLAAIAAALASAAPDFLKPNAEELGQILGLPGEQLEADAERGELDGVRDAALALHARGVGAVLVTLGGAGGVLATDGGAWYSPSAPVEVVSTVGAGDSATAGYLIGRALGEDPPARLARALAYGTAAVGLPGTTIPRPDQVRPDPGAVRRL